MTDQPLLRVGLVGCGVDGTNLGLAAARSEFLQLVACADPDESAAKRAASTTAGVSVHKSIESLLDVPSVDVVLVATPHDELAPTALAAIRARKHVMIEKPMAMDDAQAREVESAANEAGVNCMVGYLLRFSTGKHVHDLIAGGHVGHIDGVTGYIGVPPMNRSWMSSTERGGGPLLYVGCHLVDFVLWFTGDEPASVFADVRRRANTGTDEVSAIHVQLVKGAMAQLLVKQTAPAFGYDLRIYGRSGDIGLRGRNLFQAELEIFSTSAPAFRQPPTIRPVPAR